MSVRLDRLELNEKKKQMNEGVIKLFNDQMSKELNKMNESTNFRINE